MEIDLGQWSVGCSDCLANGSSMKSRILAVDVWEAVCQKAAPKAEEIGFLRRVIA